MLSLCLCCLVVVGYKCYVDEKFWIGINKKVLENEIVINCVKLQNIFEFSIWCEKVEVFYFYIFVI